jgi:hypothetical protein
MIREFQTTHDMTQFNKQVFKIRHGLLLALFILLGTTYALQAQVGTPTYINNTGTSANAFPWNSTTSNKVQYIYAPSVFSTLGGGAGTAAPSGYLIPRYM